MHLRVLVVLVPLLAFLPLPSLGATDDFWNRLAHSGTGDGGPNEGLAIPTFTMEGILKQLALRSVNVNAGGITLPQAYDMANLPPGSDARAEFDALVNCVETVGTSDGALVKAQKRVFFVEGLISATLVATQTGLASNPFDHNGPALRQYASGLIVVLGGTCSL